MHTEIIFNRSAKNIILGINKVSSIIKNGHKFELLNTYHYHQYKLEKVSTKKQKTISFLKIYLFSHMQLC